MFGRAGTRGAAPGAHAATTAASSIRSRSEADDAAARPRRARSRRGSSDYLDNVREIERRIQRSRDAATATRSTVAGRADRHARVVRGARRADVRPAGAGLPGRPHARLHVHDGPRRQPADVSGDRRQRTAPRACRTTATSRRRSRSIAKMNTYHVELFAKFLEKLRTTPDGDGSLLDHSMILYGSGMSDSNTHRARIRCRSSSAAARGGRSGNRHITDARRTPMANLMLERRAAVRLRDREVRRAAPAASSSGSAGDGRPSSSRCWAIACTAGSAVATAAGRRTAVRAVAARRGEERRHATAARALLQQRADVNAAEADGTTALHWAVRADDCEIVTACCGQARTPTRANRYGVTPLSLAAKNGDARMFETLLEGRRRSERALPEGETVLMTAARTGSAGGDQACCSRTAPDERRGAAGTAKPRLMWAAAENHADAVKRADRARRGRQRALEALETFRISATVGPDAILPRGGWTPLMYAARQNALDAARAARRGARRSQSRPIRTARRR